MHKVFGAFLSTADSILFILRQNFTVFAKLSEAKLSQLSSEDDGVSMEINFTYLNSLKFFFALQSFCCKTEMAILLNGMLAAESKERYHF